jgi:hypothetical protein
MVKAWLLVLFVTFPVSVLALTYVQTRVARERGWFGLYESRFVDTYWRDLSVLLRWLVWPGLVAFAITGLGCTVLLILQHFGLITEPIR